MHIKHYALCSIALLLYSTSFAIVTGRIIDGATSQPVKGAIVVIPATNNQGELRDTTLSNGTFSLGDATNASQNSNFTFAPISPFLIEKSKVHIANIANTPQIMDIALFSVNGRRIYYLHKNIRPRETHSVSLIDIVEKAQSGNNKILIFKLTISGEEYVSKFCMLDGAVIAHTIISSTAPTTSAFQPTAGGAGNGLPKKTAKLNDEPSLIIEKNGYYKTTLHLSGLSVSIGDIHLTSGDSVFQVESSVNSTTVSNLTIKNYSSTSRTYTASLGTNAMNISPSSVSIGGSEQKSFALSLPCTENKTTSGIITITSNDNYKTEVCIPVRGICWGNRITITKGGTYEGNWESTDGTNPAVDIKTSEPVIIEKSWIRAKGPAKIIQGDFIKATIRDCHAYGLPSDKAGGAPSQFFRTTYPRSIVMENNYIEGASLTFFLQNSGNSTPVTKCHVRYNQVRNIDGRVKDGAKCTGSDMLPDAVGHHCATGFVAVNRLDSSDVDISWNEIINEPYKGNQDVIINFVNSRGTPAKPIRIHNNFIHGQYAVDPATEISYGGGINAGDATSGAPASKVPQFVWVYDNQVVNIMKGGVATVAGNNIKIYRNRVVSTGKLPNGTPFHDHAGGIVIWDCCYSHKSKGVWHNIEVYDNKIGYLDKNGNSKVFYDRKDCTTDVNGNSQCHDNTEIPAPITKEMEDAEYDQWLKKVNEQNIRLGPR